MSKCDFCHKTITQKDYDGSEAYLYAPRGFLGEGWHNWCWKKVDSGGNYFPTIEQHSLCKKCRKGYTMSKTFADLKTAQDWVLDMLFGDKETETKDGIPLCPKCEKPMIASYDKVAKKITGYQWECPCMPGIFLSVG